MRWEQSRLEGIMKAQLFSRRLFIDDEGGWRESTGTFRRSAASGAAVMSSTVTHSNLSHRQVFLHGFFRVAVNTVINESKFLISQLSPSCVFKHTLAVPPSASGSLCCSFTACQCWQKSLLGWSSFFLTLDSGRFLVWKQLGCHHSAEHNIFTATVCIFTLFSLIIIHFLVMIRRFDLWPLFFWSSFKKLAIRFKMCLQWQPYLDL